MESTPMPRSESDLDLTVPFHTRISARAQELLRERAQATGLKPATWGRIELYRALGLIGPPKAKRKRRAS
jgi:hypothetical protein